MRQLEHIRVDWSLLMTLYLLAAVGMGLLPRTSMAQINPVVLENQQLGSTGWEIDTDRVGTDAVGQIKGYASAVSVNKGENITFHVSTNPAQTYTIDVYRIGWYQGLGGRLMQQVGPLNGVTQPTCPMDATTGMIECQWAPAYTLATQTSWTSGVYLALLKNQQGYQNYIIFVLRDDNRVAPLLYQQAVTTYQAYNPYPNDGLTGKSLYDFNSFGPVLASTGYKSAAKVSFDRPYSDTGIDGGVFSDYGEINFIRWIERSGYDVTYATNVETHTNGNRLLNYRGFLSVGHDEYWSKPMYDAAEAARDAGVNLGFFGADPVYWQIRFEPSSGGVPNRVVVCYKDSADTSRDPVTDPSLKTVLWRDPPVNRPEQTLVGVQYTNMVPYNNGAYVTYVVNNSGNWVYAGTGFKDGDTVPVLVGYEADRFFIEYPGPNAVPGTYALLSHSPFNSAHGPDYSSASIYQAPSGAWVFGSGTMNWNWGLDSYQHGWNVVDPRIQRATANILDRFIANPLPDFTLAASPSSQTAAPGGSTSYGVTINPKGGFTDPVTLSVTGLPTGATGTFTPNPATASSTLAVTTAASTPEGVYTLTITGASSNLIRTTTVALAVFRPDFALSATPASQTVVRGSSASYGVTISPAGSFSGNVTLSVTGLPTGATGTFTPNPATASSTLAVTTAASTPEGVYTLTVTGAGSSLIRTTTISLGVVTTPPPPPPPSGVTFDAIGPSSAGVSVLSGSSLSWSHTVAITGSNRLLTVGVAVGKSPDTGTSLAVTYGGVPMTSAGIVHSNNRTDGFVELFYLTAPATGANTVQVTLAGGPATMEGGSVSFTGVNQTTPVRNIATNHGSSSSPNVSVTSVPGDMVVDALVTGCSGVITSGTTLGWLSQVNCATGGGNGAQSIAAGAGSVTMGYTVPSDWWGMIGMDVVAAGAPPTSFDFTLSNEGNKSVAQGAAVTNTVTATLSSGTAQGITFSASGLPAGVTASFNPTSCSPTCSTTLTISADASAPIGTSTIIVTGTAGSVSHTTTFALTVSALTPPDFTLSGAPASQTVTQGGATSYGVTITPSGGFSGPVTLSVTGLPTGATGTFTPNPATTSSTLAVTTAASTPAGSYPLTLTGVSGSLAHTATVTLVVSALTPPDFTLSGAPASQTVTQGGATSYGVTITPSGGFSGPVTLSVTGLPTGATGTFTPNPATTSSTLAVTTAASTPAGSYPLTLTGVSGSLAHTATVTLVVASVGITVTSPNTAVSWRVTTTQNITFTHNLGVGKTVNIDVSRDGGSSWSLITTFTTTSATTGTYSWSVSGPPTSQARIRVSSAVNPLVTDTSDVNFTIVNPVVTVTAPNTAVSWRAGDTKNITFTHNLGAGKTVNIDVSRDGGATWSLVTTFSTTSATSGTYPWVVSGPPTTQARIRVSWTVDPSVTDNSNVNFTILPRTTVTAPNTAVTWGAGSTRKVTWNHNLGVGGLVDIDFSSDNGATWVPVASAVPSATATTGTYTGPMPTIVTTQGLIRVNPMGGLTLGDVSDVPFTLVTPAVTVTAPNTNVSWATGSARSIKWSHNLGTLDSVKIELARDGVNYTETIAESVINTANTSGTYSWVVTGPASTTVRIRVTWINNATVSDVSNVNFRIQ